MKRILIAIFVITSLTTSAQDSVLLRLNYSQGDNYVVTVDSKQSMGILGGTSMNVTMGMNIVEVDEKNIKTESIITYILMNIMQGGTSMSYDSNKKEEELDQMGQLMKSQFDPMMNATIHTTLDNTGNTIETKIEPPIPGMEQFTGSSNAINYPKEKVSVGSSWTSENENKGVIMSTINTVSSIADGVVTLDISGEVSGAATGIIKGETIVDISSGAPTSSTLKITISAQGMDMNIVTNSTTTKN
jgi:hypothetical protein